GGWRQKGVVGLSLTLAAQPMASLISDFQQHPLPGLKLKIQSPVLRVRSLVVGKNILQTLTETLIGDGDLTGRRISGRRGRRLTKRLEPRGRHASPMRGAKSL